MLISYCVISHWNTWNSMLLVLFCAWYPMSYHLILLALDRKWICEGFRWKWNRGRWMKTWIMHSVHHICFDVNPTVFQYYQFISTKDPACKNDLVFSVLLVLYDQTFKMYIHVTSFSIELCKSSRHAVFCFFPSLKWTRKINTRIKAKISSARTLCEVHNPAVYYLYLLSHSTAD